MSTIQSRIIPCAAQFKRRRQTVDSNFLGNSNGFSLIEIMITIGIMGIMMLVMISMQSNQLKSNNYLEFQLKRAQLQGTLLGQVLKDPNNCTCLFRGATDFPTAGTTTLAGVAPTRIGPYTSPAPGCNPPTEFFIDGTGIDGLRATSISLQNITPTADPNLYTGLFNVNIQSTKEVIGPRDLMISIPVSVSTTPSGANVSFVSCSISPAPSASMGVVGTEGWVRRQDGLLEQWGYVSAAPYISGSEYTIPITYSKPFADNNYNLTLSTVVPAAPAPYDNFVQEINGTRSPTGVTVWSQDPSAGGTNIITGLRWHAIGL